MLLMILRGNIEKKLRKLKNRVLSGKNNKGIIFLGEENAVYSESK